MAARKHHCHQDGANCQRRQRPGVVRGHHDVANRGDQEKRADELDEILLHMGA
jgi:hypothetical protein